MFILTLSYMRVQILHILFYNYRDHVRFYEWQIEALGLPVTLNSTKHRRKLFSERFVFIK